MLAGIGKGQASFHLLQDISWNMRLEVIHMATMQALVTAVERNRLLVLDFSTRRRVIVNTPSARRFHRGDIVRIRYNGVMTASIPPQIYAQNIFAIPRGIFW